MYILQAAAEGARPAPPIWLVLILYFMLITLYIAVMRLVFQMRKVNRRLEEIHGAILGSNRTATGADAGQTGNKAENLDYLL